MSDNIKILMCSFTGGNRGPGNAFYNHINSLNASENFEVQLISESHLQNPRSFEKYDIFWFSVRFHPQLYLFLKRNFSHKRFVMGPNVLFEKPEQGLSDSWEEWFVNNVSCDLYFNKSDFYLSHAKKIFKGSEKYFVLPNCLDVKSNNFNKNDSDSCEKKEKVLIYSKKRRIDNQFFRLYPLFIEKLKKEKISFDVIEYGKYEKHDLLKKAGDYSACFWFSIEDYCSNAQLEIQLCGTPIIGTPFNATHVFDNSFNVEGSNFNENWISWKENIGDLYVEKLKEKEKEINSVGFSARVKKYIQEFHSYEYYSQNLLRILS